MVSSTEFSEQNLKTVLSGSSIIDFQNLEIKSLEEANQFIQSYGYDVSNEGDLEKLWEVHRKSVSMLREHLMEEGEKIPEELSDPSLLGQIANLLLIVSQKEPSEKKKWACAILKVMHAFFHVQNDLFSQYSEQIQDQILRRYNAHISEDPILGTKLGSGSKSIHLHRFEVKPFKKSSSSVIKLLSKKQAVSISLLDKLGVRFITKNIYDSFRVIQYLLKEYIVSLPNIIPEQSHNNLYPINLFLESIGEISFDKEQSQDIEKLLLEKLENQKDRAEFKVKENQFSSSEYRFMKFICRQLVEIDLGDKNMRFFFPYEVQIVNYGSYIKNISGPQAHSEYKKRQKASARQRIFGL